MSVNTGTIQINTIEQRIQTDFSRNILYIGVLNNGIGTDWNLVEIKSKKDIADNFGTDSEIGINMNYAIDIKRNKEGFEDSLFLYGIGFDNESSTKATAIIDFDGTATENATATIKYNGKTNNILIQNGYTATQVASAINTAIANLEYAPFTSVVDGVDSTILNLTAKNAGTFLNTTRLKITNLPSGITVTSNTGFTGGNYSAIVNLTNLKNTITTANKRFHAVVIDKGLFNLDATLIDFFNNNELVINIDRQNIIYLTEFSSSVQSEPLPTKQVFVNTIIYEGREAMSTLFSGTLATYRNLMLLRNSNISDVDNVGNGVGGLYNLASPLNEFVIRIIDPLEINFNETDLKTLKERGFLTVENNEKGTVAIYSGNQTTYIRDNDGNTITELNRFNQRLIIQEIRSLLLEIAKAFKNKTLVSEDVSDSFKKPFDITKSDIQIAFDTLLSGLASARQITQPNGTVQSIIYGIISNDPIVLDNAKIQIKNQIDKIPLNTRNLNLVFTGEVSKNIENILITLIVS